MTLRVDDLEGWYGEAQVLFGVSLSVGPGEVVALLGRNGAGKSTTLKAIGGWLDRRAGRITFGALDLSRAPAYAVARAGIASVPEERRIFTDLTVAENLAVGRQPRRPGAPFWTPARLAALFPNLGSMMGRRGGAMSGGEQQMLAIARGLMGNPSLVLLDEPSEGIAPMVVADLARAIVALKREGLGMLVSEQNLRFAREVADRLVILERGRVVFGGSFAALDAAPEVARTFLSV